MREEYLAGSAAALADCFMERNGVLDRTWSYDYGVVWRGMEMLEALTGDPKYFAYIRDGIDSPVDESGTIRDCRRLSAGRLRGTAGTGRKENIWLTTACGTGRTLLSGGWPGKTSTCTGSC